MPNEMHTPPPTQPDLSKCLLALREKTLEIEDDMKRVLGILENIHTAQNAYDLLHRLRSIIGRERLMQKLSRQWIALLEPITTIAESIQVENG